MYNKNFQEIATSRNLIGGSDSSDSGKKKYRTFTFDFLFKKLIDYSEEQAQARVRQVASWKIKSTENILKSLLINN